MLTHGELVTLERSLRGTRVLSVYLDGAGTDPAVQHAWRVRLDHELSGIRARLAGASREEREQFAACLELLEGLLQGESIRAGAPGWVAFITPEGVRHAGPMLAPMPVLAKWGHGACITPYLRAIKASRPAIVAVVDGRKATLYRYQTGSLEVVTTLHAHHDTPALSHMGDAPRAGFHTGTRGLTGRDAAQRARLAGMIRMIAELADRVTALAGDDGWILLGGIPRVVAHAARALGPVASRVMTLESVDVHATPAQVAEAAKRGAAALQDAWDARQLEELASNAGTTGVLGPEATERALQLATVRSLYLSEHYVAEHDREAQEALRRALDQHAAIEEVSRAAAHWLDEHGGIAARLRYRPPVDLGVPLQPELRATSAAEPHP